MPHVALPTCEVCGNPLSRAGAHATGTCMTCRMAGADFARGWAATLADEHQLPYSEVAEIVGLTSADEARARASEHRRKEATLAR